MDVQVRNVQLPKVDVAIEGLKRDLQQIVQTYELTDIADWETLLEKWDAINARDNSFLVSAHFVTAAFEEGQTTYFRKFNLKDMIKNELKLLKYDITDRPKPKKKGDNDPDDDSQDLVNYFELSATLQQTLCYMSTNRQGLYDYFEKVYDFVYFVHVGTKLHDPKSQVTKALYILPMEIALWVAAKKIEIGFETGLWSAQIMPYALYWFLQIINQSANYRENLIGKFTETEQQAVAMNQYMLKSYDERRKKQVSDLIFMEAKIAYVKAVCQILLLLEEEGVLKKFMNDKELSMAYDTKIYNPFKDYFFMRRPNFSDCQKALRNQNIEYATSVNVCNKGCRLL